MYSLPHYQHLSPGWYIHYNWWAYIDTSLLPKVLVHVRVQLGGINYGLDKAVMTWIHHYSIIQSCFIVLKICSTISSILSVLPLNPRPPLIFFYHLHRFALFRMSYYWNHKVCSLSDWLLSLSNTHLSFLHVF